MSFRVAMPNRSEPNPPASTTVEPAGPVASLPSSATVRRPPKPPSGLLAGMRIRKKLIFLHTLFSLALAAILALSLRPAVREVIEQSESHEARLVLAQMLDGERSAEEMAELAGRVSARSGPGVSVRVARERESGLSATEAAGLRDRTGPALSEDSYLALSGPDREPVLIAHHPASDLFVVVTVRLEGARDAVIRLYVLATIALLSVYALVAAALEIFVLPRHVYGPIRSMLAADRALEEGRSAEEIIPDAAMPADELGEIMRSRNRAVRSLRQHERDLAAALSKLEHAAADLKKKNHLLETARQNLADTGRLAGLGMMSAGLAHEMNTPLAVLKVLAEKTGSETAASTLTSEEAALMRRVVGRLEGLSEGLLDIARARPLSLRSVALRPIVDEAWTLVRMDRRSDRVQFRNRLKAGDTADADADRLLQVFVNLLRNAVDSMTDHAEGVARDGAGRNGAGRGGSVGEGDIGPDVLEVSAGRVERDGKAWVSIVIADTGPGIAPDVLAHLFEPFVSTRLDAHGTGLGLAVSEGIVREHRGVLIARNRSDADRPGRRGAEFEILLPLLGSATGAGASGPVDPSEPDGPVA